MQPDAGWYVAQREDTGQWIVLLEGRSEIAAVQRVVEEANPYPHLISPHFAASVGATRTRVFEDIDEDGQWCFSEQGEDSQCYFSEGEDALLVDVEPHITIRPQVLPTPHPEAVRVGDKTYLGVGTASLHLARDASGWGAALVGASDPNRALMAAYRAAELIRKRGGHVDIYSTAADCPVDIRCSCPTCAPEGCSCAYCGRTR
jgi:hypothetical protein